MSITVEGFNVPTAEVLLILKQKAYQNRAGSTKGEKDRIDIISLLNSVNFKKYAELLKKFGVEKCSGDLKQILQSTRQVEELKMSEHAFAGFRKKQLARIFENVR